MIVSWNEIWTGRQNVFSHPAPNPLYKEEVADRTADWKWIERYIPTDDESKGVHRSVVKFPG